ncbi:uncharacterized protein LOC131875157 [Cryptomeria japonica]|uniref:uncharacterized protein LOC131875157 n=1 Tax=Cryptomeria japonica TaxID=3369 RepID=UPI0027DA2DC3|nr:uncharacterized protein LOC131875157 [Cryptomeria japonica]
MSLPRRVLRQFREVQVTPVVTAYFARVSQEVSDWGIQHPRQRLRIDMEERVKGGEGGGLAERGDEGDGGVEGGEEEGGDDGEDEDIDIGGDTKSTSSRDDDDSLGSSSSEDGEDDDDTDMPELEDVLVAEGGGG